jgi:hypothetical protein
MNSRDQVQTLPGGLMRPSLPAQQRRRIDFQFPGHFPVRKPGALGVMRRSDESLPLDQNEPQLDSVVSNLYRRCGHKRSGTSLSASLFVCSVASKRQKLPSGSLFHMFPNSLLSLGHKTCFSNYPFFAPWLATCQTPLWSLWDKWRGRRGSNPRPLP